MIASGLIAGAAGTAALDLASYGDMVARGRGASELPAKVVATLAERIGLRSFASATDDASASRRSALGAILGYAIGLGAGVVYVAVRPSVRPWLPWPVAGLLLGGATLVASEGSATALGATDWRTWSASEWIADVVPRSLYGLVVAWAVETFSDIDDETIAFGALRAMRPSYEASADLPYAAARAIETELDADLDVVDGETRLLVVDEEHVT